MLNGAKDFDRYSVRAADDAVGGVDDLYFDDESWTVRYVVVGTGGSILPRRALLAPRFVSEVDAATRVLYTGLTREQLENGPSIEADLPVAAQQEADYYAYYGTDPYWAGWLGMAPGPAGATYTSAFPVEQPTRARGLAASDGRPGDPHLRSVRQVEGYRIRSMDGEIGHLEDFLVDDEAWVIRYIVVDTRNWLPGKKVLISTRWISGVSWADAEVHADLGSIEIKEAPAWDPGTPVDREYEIGLHSYYGRPPYWVYDR